jgi:ketosteroid isomerase-like protein
MSIALPLPISSYFDAKNAHDVDAMLATFASDALVHDEKRDFVGRVAIREWTDGTTRKYRVTATPTGIEQAGETTIVTATVAGNFPGSPAELHFRFRVGDGKIAGLAID